MFLGPSCRCHVLNLPVGHCRQTFEHVAKIGLWINATAAAGFDDREQDGTAQACFSLADEQPVLLADGGGADGILHRVVVDLDPAVCEINDEHRPMRQCVVDGPAHGALGQVTAAALHAGDGPMDALHDHAAVTGTQGLPLLRTSLGPAQLLFDVVEVLDLQQQPAGVLRGAFDGFMELAPGVCPARRQGDAAFVAFGKGRVGLIAVALHGAGEVSGDDALQAECGTAGGPGEAHVGSGPFAGPEVFLFRLAVAEAQVFNGRFIHLHITARHHAGVDALIDGSQPVSGKPQPACHALPWDIDVVPGGIDLLLPVERQMIAILRHDDLCEQTRRGDAALLQGVECRDDGSLMRLVAPHILPADDATAQEPCRLVVELLGDFFTNVPPCVGRSGDFFRLDDFINGGQMLRHACLAFFAGFNRLAVLAALFDLSLQGAGAFLPRHPLPAAA